MRTPRIYTDQKLTIKQNITLDESASNHVVRVLRLSEGAKLTLFDGNGGLASATLSHAHKKQAQCHIETFTELSLESPLQCHIAVVLAKGDKMEWIVQKATELGVKSITPLSSERSDIKLNHERLHKKLQQWQQVAIAACEQSGRNHLPEIRPLQTLQQWFETSTNGQKVFFHPTAAKGLKEISQPTTDLHLCFGPEGGFSELEVEQAQAHCQTIKIGPRILRAETAPIAVLGALQTLFGDWS